MIQRVLCLSLGILGAVLPAQAAFKYFDASVPGAAPALLSQTGIYANITAKTMDPAAKPFEVNAPLWSDGAVKKRWILLRPGKQIPYDDTTDYFTYPDSTVFVKNFSLVRAPGDTVYWETRLLIKKRGSGESPVDWFGFSYRWNAAQTDASLVPPGSGLDTVFFATDAKGKRTYRKWRFPSQGNCNSCHVGRGETGTEGLHYGRGVLGFFPAQLKRPSAGGNQVLDLFTQGVFTGTRPTAPALARRFKGIHESIPGGLGAGQRFAIIDTMARSYIAANCSGCHGARGNDLHTTGEVLLDYDFHNLKPRMEFGLRPVGDRGLFDPLAYDTNSVTDGPTGRSYYLMALGKWGIPTGSGNWDMTLPTASAKVLVYPGYPAASTLLFRQWVRKSPWTDSGVVARTLKYDIQFGDPPQQALAQQRRVWIFSRPWGSQAWQDTLAKHGLTLDSLIALIDLSSRFYDADGDQMPPLATFEPDTAALAVLGEWAKGYQESYASIRPGPHGAGSLAMATVRDGILRVPGTWQGPAEMLDMQGRVYGLKPSAPFTYALPPALTRGVYAFRIGMHAFRASIL